MFSTILLARKKCLFTKGLAEKGWLYVKELLRLIHVTKSFNLQRNIVKLSLIFGTVTCKSNNLTAKEKFAIGVRNCMSWTFSFTCNPKI